MRGSKGYILTILTIFSPILVRGENDSISTLYSTIQEVEIVQHRATFNPYSLSSEQNMNRDMIKSIGAGQLSDALKYFGGVTVKDYGGIGGLKSISVRGLGATHTVIAYDGIIDNNMQTGQVDMGRISTSSISSIRLVNGVDNDNLLPAMLCAAASTLNVLAEDSASGSSLTLKGGSYKTNAAAAKFSTSPTKKLYIKGEGEWNSSAGNYPYVQNNGVMSQTMYRENSDVRRCKLDLTLRYKRERKVIQLRSHTNISEQGLPTNILYNSLATERTWSRDIFVQGGFRDESHKRIKFQILGKYSNSSLRYLNSSIHNSNGMIDNRYREKQLYVSVAAYSLITPELSLSLANDITYGMMEGTTFSISHPERFQLNSAIRAKYVNQFLTAAVGANYLYTSDITTNHITPYIATNISPFSTIPLHLRASLKSAIRVPTFNDLYFEQVGQRNLKPENALLHSIGIAYNSTLLADGKQIGLNIYSDLFYNRIKDKIVAVPGKSVATWMMHNIGHVIARGIEIGSDCSVAFNHIAIKFVASYTYQRAMDKTSRHNNTYNHQTPYTPRHSGSTILAITTSRFGLGANSFFSGAYYSNSYNGDEYYMPPYSEMGITSWYLLPTKRRNIELQGEIINLFDNRYEVVANYPMPGRQFRVGVTIKI